MRSSYSVLQYDMFCLSAPLARTILSWAGRPQNNSAAEGVLRDLCAPIGPSIATLARGRGPDYARAAVGRVPQVRVQLLHFSCGAAEAG